MPASLMTENDIEDLSQATADALAKVSYDITRWREAGATSPGVVALLYAWFSNEIYRNGISGWVGHGYTRRGEHRVLAALTHMYAAIDPDIAAVMLEAFQRVELCRGEPGALPAHVDALLWERPMRRLRFGWAVAARWKAEADPFVLTPQWKPPRATLAPTEGAVRYPSVAVGLTERGAHLDVRMESFDTFDFLTVTGAVTRGLWLAGASDEEMGRFLREAQEERAYLGETCARWICFDGDGGDAARFHRIHRAMFPPDPLLAWFPEVNDWHGLFSLPEGLVERLHQALKDVNYLELKQSAAELPAALQAAFRSDPDAVGVLRGETLSPADIRVFELLVQSSLTGHRVIIFGLREAARQALRIQAARFHQLLREPSSA